MTSIDPVGDFIQSNARGIWETVATLTVDYAEWLVDLFSDPEAADIIRAELEMASDPVPPLSLPAAEVALLRSFGDGLASEPLSEVRAALGTVMDQVDVIVRAIDSDLGPDDPTWTHTYRLGSIYLGRRAMDHAPVVHAIGKAFGIFTEKFGTIPGLDLVGLLKLLAKPPSPEPGYDPGLVMDEYWTNRVSDGIVFAVQQVFLSAMNHKMHEDDDWFDSYYGWDTPVQHEGRADVRLLERMYTMVFRAIYDDDTASVAGSLTTTAALVSQEHGGPGLFLSLAGGEFSASHTIGNRIVSVDVFAPSPGGLYLHIWPPFGDLDATFGFEGVKLGLRLDPTPDLAGQPQRWLDYDDGALWFRIDQVQTGLDIGGAAGFSVGVRTTGHVGVRRTAHTLLEKLFDRDIEVDFDLGYVFGRTNGLAAENGSGTTGQSPAKPPESESSTWLRLHDVGFGLLPSGHDPDTDLPVGVEAFITTSVTVDLGPFTATVENFGGRATVGLSPTDPGFDIGFDPPRGIAMSLETAGFKGGGYLSIDPDGVQYSGVIELSWGQFSLKAIGVLTTEVPDRPDSWAFVALITFEFPPWGPLSGVGGVLGYHHGLDIDALQSGLRTGVLDSILFPQNPLANVAQTINHVRAIFPIVPDAVTVGIMLKFSDGSGKFEAMIGVLLQWDNATWGSEGSASLNRLSVIGRVAITIPGGSTKPKLRLQLDIAGSYDFGARYLAVDGMLRDSKVGKLTLTGSGSIRRQGRRNAGDTPGLPAAQPSQIMTIGGWHPRFTDVPSGVPKQKRVGFYLKSKEGASTTYRVSFMSYFASTPNTTQIGLEAKAKAKKWGFTLSGRFSFDGIWYENPDYFELDIEFEASVKKGNKTYLKIDLDVYLRGSGHWIFTGVATIKLWFISKTLHIHEEWGPELPVATQSFRVEDAIEEAIADARNWTPELPPEVEMLVSLRDPDGPSDLLAHPLGNLSFTQNVVPLGVTIDRFGAFVPEEANRFEIDRVQLLGGDDQPETITPLTDYFAPGEYLDLTPEEKLTTPSFERFQSGVRIDVAEHALPDDFWVSAAPNYDLKYRGRDLPDAVVATTFEHTATAAQVAAVARSTIDRNPFAGAAPRAQVTVKDPTVVVADESFEAVAGTETTTYTEARRARTRAAHLVVETHELETVS